MIRARVALTTSAMLFAGVVYGAQQTIAPDAVLIRGTKNQLVVTTVMAKPGDKVEISGGILLVNDRQTDVRLESGGDWGPKVVDPNTYFVAGDPAGLATDTRGWGLVPADRIVGTVRIGALPRP